MIFRADNGENVTSAQLDIDGVRHVYLHPTDVCEHNIESAGNIDFL